MTTYTAQKEFEPLVTFEPHKLGGITVTVGGFSFRAENEGEAGSRLRKYLIDEIQRLSSKFTPEEQLANVENAVSGAASPGLLKAAQNFVAWVEDVWGSAALSEETRKEYEEAKQAIAQAQEGKP